jgi:hypothetical protein
MRRADAPPAGWYPDPRGGSRLRWWDGTDWTDIYRAPPTQSELMIRARAAGRASATHHTGPAPGAVGARGAAALGKAETEDIVAQVRQAARSEIDHAADVFTQRAQAASRQIQPLVTQYTNRVLKWVRIILVVTLLLIIAWFLFQTIAQVSFFEWLGDRIDNITDE